MVLGGAPIGGAPIGGGPMGTGESGGGTEYGSSGFRADPGFDPTIAFRNLAEEVPTTEYGTYHSWLIPEPDSPLTMGWVEAMGLGVARCMLGGYGEITITDKFLEGENCDGTTTLTGQNYFSKIPFTRVYLQKDISGQNYFYDAGEGYGNNEIPIGGGVDGYLYFLEESSDLSQFAWVWAYDGNVLANQRTGTWCIVANGR